MSRISRPASVVTPSKPAGVPNSVFQAGAMARPPKQRRSAPVWIDPDAIVIDTGLPLPGRPPRRSNQQALRAVLERMGPGKSVLLSLPHSRALVKIARAQGVATRTELGAGGLVRVHYAHGPRAAQGTQGNQGAQGKRP
jgi:hypothetical protein